MQIKIWILSFFLLAAVVGVVILIREQSRLAQPQNRALIRTAQAAAALPPLGKIASAAPTPPADLAPPPANSNASAANSIYDSAARQNADLKTNLVWSFGGKPQRGWYLHEALIAELLQLKPTADATDFARSLAGWQQTAGLEPNGVLDETTISAIIKTWQSNRLKERVYATPDKLLTAPASDFWDVTRAADLRQVEIETYRAYKKMIRAAAEDKSLKLSTNGDGTLHAGEKFLKIVSAFRSREHQDRLRAASPNSGRAGLALNSPHFTGRALDLFVGGEPVETRDDNRRLQINTPVYKWLVKNAGKFGFKPYFYEPWHWEYTAESADSLPNK